MKPAPYTLLHKDHPYEQNFRQAQRSTQVVRGGIVTLALAPTAFAVVVTSLFLVHAASMHGIASATWLPGVAWLIALGCWAGALPALWQAQHLQQRLAAMRRQYDQAQQIDELKDQFINSVNHELRNPIMAMMGYLDIIDLSLEQGKPDQVPSYVARAIGAGYRLRELINSILDTSRQDRGARDFTPAPVDVRTALDAALILLNPQEGGTLARILQIQIPPDTLIWGEPVRLQQILRNLLSNAVKYSPPGAPVEISAEVHPALTKGRKQQQPELVEIVVRDHGFGIPPDQIPLLFNRFVRLPRDLASKTIGNGLGLHLCMVLTEAMEGALWVESQGIVGDGATFHILLPTPTGKISAPPAAT